MNRKLSYKNEDDKCYGATGMAMAVVIFDGEEMLASVDVDADPGEMVQLTENFYFNGNPGFSAKSAWNRILANFNLAMALSIGNVACRRQIYESRPVEVEIREFLRNLMIETGREQCALDDDETSRLFDKNFAYLTRVFAHNGVKELARDFAAAIRQRRRMSRLDVIEQLRALSML